MENIDWSGYYGGDGLQCKLEIWSGGKEIRVSKLQNFGVFRRFSLTTPTTFTTPYIFGYIQKFFSSTLWVV